MKDFVIENRVLKKYRGLKRDVVIPDGVEVIAKSAFEKRRSIKSIHIPEGVTKIEKYSFSDCDSLQRVSLPNSIVFCGYYSFSPWAKSDRYKGCYYLGNNENPYHVLWKDYYDTENAPELHSNTKLIMDGLHRPFDELPASAYTKYDNAFYVGSTDNPYHLLVKAINTDIKTCCIHKDTKIINISAFQDCCNLEAVTVPEGVCHIGSTAFMGCSNLQKVGLPNSLKAISRATFKWCEKMEEIVIPNSVLHIGDQAFHGCESLVDVIVPNGVLTLEDCSFGMCHNLQKVVLPETLISIDGGIFCSGKIDTSIHAPAGSYAIQYAKENGLKYEEI